MNVRQDGGCTGDQSLEIDRPLPERDPLDGDSIRVLVNNRVAQVEGNGVRPKFLDGSQRILRHEDGIAGVEVGSDKLLAGGFDQLAGRSLSDPTRSKEHTSEL